MPHKAPWIGTGWKMNKVRAEAKAFAQALKDSPYACSEEAQLFVIPPFPYVAEVSDILADTRIAVGVQNVHWEDRGAWTGEVSPLMVKDCGAGLVEIGHSERRSHFGETDETVALKVKAALKHGLLALVCIGDTRAEFLSGRTAWVLARQTRMALSQAGRTALGKVVFAYEPVWSIGEGGTPADPDFADEQHRLIKDVAADIAGGEPPVLYGGSVNLGNCGAFARRAHIDGLFIGRAGWDVASYLGIVDKVVTAQGRTG